jgi:hypothetical protein
MEYLAAAALGGLVVLAAAGWGWHAAGLVGQEPAPRGVPGAMRLVVDNRRVRPPSAAQEALNRLEAVVAAHRLQERAGAGHGATRSPRQS